VPGGANHSIRHRQAKVGLLHHHDRLVPILEEVSDAFVAAIEGPRVAGEGPTLRERGQPGEEVGPVGVVAEDGRPLNPPHHHMAQSVGRRFRTKSGIEDSGRRAESEIPDEKRKASMRACRGITRGRIPNSNGDYSGSGFKVQRFKVQGIHEGWHRSSRHPPARTIGAGGDQAPATASPVQAADHVHSPLPQTVNREP